MIGNTMKVYLVIEIKMRKVDNEKQSSVIVVFSTYEKACKHARNLKKKTKTIRNFITIMKYNNGK